MEFQEFQRSYLKGMIDDEDDDGNVSGGDEMTPKEKQKSGGWEFERPLSLCQKRLRLSPTSAVYCVLLPRRFPQLTCSSTACTRTHLQPEQFTARLPEWVQDEVRLASQRAGAGATWSSLATSSAGTVTLHGTFVGVEPDERSSKQLEPPIAAVPIKAK